jgi:hypothetical protein
VVRRQRQRADRAAADQAPAGHDESLNQEPAPPAAAPPDIGAVVAAELSRQREAEAQAAADADFERHRHPTGSGCIFCGLGCLRVADRKMRQMLSLLGLEHSIPLPALGNPQAFEHIPVWWSEHPGAVPVFDLDDRFAHVDLDALRAAWDQVLRPPVVDSRERRKGARCPHCGTRTKVVEWYVGPEGPPEGVLYEASLASGTFSYEKESCLECSRRWLARAGANVEALA